MVGFLTKKNTRPFYTHIKAKSTRLNDFVLKEPTGCQTRTSQETADLLQGYFSSVYCEDDHRPLGPQPPAPRFMDAIVFQPEVITRILWKLSPHKGPGPDAIHPALLRSLAPTLGDPQARLFGMSLTSGTVSKVWKVAHVTPIPKGGARQNASKHRPNRQPPPPSA